VKQFLRFVIIITLVHTSSISCKQNRLAKWHSSTHFKLVDEHTCSGSTVREDKSLQRTITPTVTNTLIVKFKVLVQILHNIVKLHVIKLFKHISYQMEHTAPSLHNAVLYFSF
jgi:hypothetical protein